MGRTSLHENMGKMEVNIYQYNAGKGGFHPVHVKRWKYDVKTEKKGEER